jgi:hypothetical protein
MPDTFFKILGGTDPVNQTLGVMTQGLGYPLRDVEPSASGGDVTVRDEICLNAESFNDQNPAGLGVELQVEFGAAQTTPTFDLAADGSMTCLETDEYEIALTFVVGRDQQGGDAQIYIRMLVNGVQLGSSRHAIIDTARIEIPIEFNIQPELDAGDIVTFEIIRDTDGADSGGLTAGNPAVNWNPSPSAFIQITRSLAVAP